LTPNKNSYPLITNCETVYSKDKIKYINDGEYDLNDSLKNDVCPTAFYKTIQFTYNNESINNFEKLY